MSFHTSALRNKFRFFREIVATFSSLASFRKNNFTEVLKKIVKAVKVIFLGALSSPCSFYVKSQV